MLSRVLSMVRKDKASSGLALRVSERNSVLLPFNVVLPGPQWCMPICSRCFTAQTATQGTGKAWTSCLDFFPIAVEKKKSQKQLKGERISLTVQGAGCQVRDVKT